MAKNYVEDELFEQKNFVLAPLPKGEYTACRFVRCSFASTDLSDIAFVECEFKECDLSMAKVLRTGFRTVSFTDCKLLGLRFDQCSDFLFAIKMQNCNAASSCFHTLRLKGTRFSNCKLGEADFSEADLSKAVFDGCDLGGATFDRTILEGADLRTAFNFHIDPEANRMKGAMISLEGAAGLLAKYGVVIEV